MLTWDNPILPLLLALVIISGIVIPLLIVLVSYIREQKKKGKEKKWKKGKERKGKAVRGKDETIRGKVKAIRECQLLANYTRQRHWMES